jgi:hypothetical protein
MEEDLLTTKGEMNRLRDELVRLQEGSTYDTLQKLNTFSNHIEKIHSDRLSFERELNATN